MRSGDPWAREAPRGSGGFRVLLSFRGPCLFQNVLLGSLLQVGVGLLLYKERGNAREPWPLILRQGHSQPGDHEEDSDREGDSRGRPEQLGKRGVSKGRAFCVQRLARIRWGGQAMARGGQLCSGPRRLPVSCVRMRCRHRFGRRPGAVWSGSNSTASPLITRSFTEDFDFLSNPICSAGLCKMQAKGEKC